MLETIAEFATERLGDRLEADELRRRHMDWILAWGAGLDARRQDQAETLRRVGAELANLRVALAELSRTGRACDRLQLATALAQSMFYLGATGEARDWLTAALEDSDGCPRELRARALAFASLTSTFVGDPVLGARYAEDAERVASGRVDTALRADLVDAASTSQLGLGNLAAAERLTNEGLALAQELGDPHRVAEVRNNLSYIALLSGDLDAARAVAEAGLAEAPPGDHGMTTLLMHNLFLAAFGRGAFDEATRYLREGLEISRHHGLASMTRVQVEGAAALASRSGANDVAAVLLGATAFATHGAGEFEAELRLEAEQATRSALGEEAFAELSAAGSRLSLDEAADRAQRWLVDRP
jgi:tetratricopeptide (TPR) repeat protein